MIYSITARPTIDALENVYEKILRTKDTDRVPTILVGNKCDLDAYREVQSEEGADLAQKRVPCFETSAKEKRNNEECFYELVREIQRMEGTESVPGGRRFRSDRAMDRDDRERCPLESCVSVTLV